MWLNNNSIKGYIKSYKIGVLTYKVLFLSSYVCAVSVHKLRTGDLVAVVTLELQAVRDELGHKAKDITRNARVVRVGSERSEWMRHSATPARRHQTASRPGTPEGAPSITDAGASHHRNVG